MSGAAIGPWLETFSIIKDMSWSAPHVVETGDLAWFRGPVQTFEINGEEVRFTGKYTCVIRKDRRCLRTMVI